MRVGKDFQASIPPVIAGRYEEEENERALPLWVPTEKLSDDEIDYYLKIAFTAGYKNSKYSEEQALGLLYWHRHDISKALCDLGNFTPYPEEWTAEDKYVFEQEFQYHGKDFENIRKMLPDKTMSSLIRYYYKWKKFKVRSSVVDRGQAKKSSSREDGGDKSDNEIGIGESVVSSSAEAEGSSNNMNNDDDQSALYHPYGGGSPSIMQGGINHQQSQSAHYCRQSVVVPQANVSDSDNDDVIIIDDEER